jgi:hypothetical protein
VSSLATIPVAAALLAVCGHRRELGAITGAAMVAMALLAAVSLLFVLGRLPFAADVDSYYVGLLIVFGWLFAASRDGRASGRLPRQVASSGMLLGAAGLAGSAFLTVSALAPAHSLVQHLAYSTGLLTGIPVAAYPIWLIVLSCRLPGYVRTSRVI